MIFPRIFIKCHMQTNKYLCNHLSTFRKTLMAKSTCGAWNNTKHMSYLYRHFFFISNIHVQLLGNLLVMNCSVRRHCIHSTVEKCKSKITIRNTTYVALQNIEELISIIFIIITKRAPCYASLVDNMRLSFFEADVTLRY